MRLQHILGLTMFEVDVKVWKLLSEHVLKEDMRVFLGVDDPL
jgi:hypothetical protein